MHIVHIAAEMNPFAKVGGLGDVVGGLSLETAKENHNVEVIIPKYGFIKVEGKYENIPTTKHLYLTTKYKNVNLTLIQPSENIDYFKRPNIYGYEDDAERFAFFCKTSLELLLQKKEEIDILHIHDWHTSLCAVLYKDLFKKSGLKIKKTVLNIHNLQYRGICSKTVLDKVGLSYKNHRNIFHKKNLFFPSNKINLLKAGLIYSDAIVAVSPTYAKEILSHKNGCGLTKVLSENKQKITGILNGINFTEWNPLTDPETEYHYSCQDTIDSIIKTKEENKNKLKQKLQMLPDKKPLFAFIGRLVPQKGTNLIIHAIDVITKNNGQFVLLGSSMIPKIQKSFTSLAKKYEKNKNVSFNFTYDEKLAHQIYSASDFFIMPSLFEPCGLTQMIAFRYGAIPIVHKTGGLADTVFDVDGASQNKNGFVFEKFTEKDFEKTLLRALKCDQKKLFSLIENGINTSLSLDKTTQNYIKLYKKLLSS